MKSVLNQLIQLQELDFALSEGRASSTKMPLVQLEEAIAKILKKLPEDVADRYQRLRKRYPLAVVPLVGSACGTCGMMVPIALVQAVKVCEQLQTCPHCGRFLYLPETVARQSRSTASQLQGERPPLAGIARFSSVRLMVPKLAATTREEAIAELAQTLAREGYVENADVVTDLALKREAIIGTAVEHGLAFPHVRDVEGGGLTFALGLKERGLDFGAPDGKLTKIIFLIVIPAPATAFYLRLLAGLVKTFSETEARRALLECDTPAQMWKTLTRLTRSTIP
ncbi:MAG: PTS sugar transporter subunit IIA [Verrucomicrobiae bacterium]|nr:PTS sugar transporter subunit IIA [Verrucomicrobiae bacterium]